MSSGPVSSGQEAGAAGSGAEVRRGPGRQALVLVALGAALVLVAAGRPWVDASYIRPEPWGDVLLSLTGGDLVAVLPVLALVALAGAGALWATHGAARSLLAVLVAAVGLLVVGLTARVLIAPADALPGDALAERPGPAQAGAEVVGVTPWPWLALLGGAVILIGGASAVRGRVPAVDSGPRAAREDEPETAESMWRAQDLGNDPTRP